MLLEIGFERVEPGNVLRVLKPEILGVLPCLPAQLIRLLLYQVDDAFVVAEVLLQQFRVPVEPEAFYDKSIKMSYKEIGKTKSTWFGVAETAEYRPAREKLVAMRSRNSLDSITIQ